MDSTIKLPSGRARLAAVIGQAGDVVHIDDVVRILGLPRVKAAKLLSRWTKQGWLRRVGKGAYVAAPLDMLDSEQVVEDGWVLVPALFDPAYIGGRTAAEIWDLTEQIFRDILVFTAKPVRQKAVETGGVVFTLKHVDEENIFGCKTEWRGKTKVPVSDIHKTIVDMMNDPETGGGIQHVVDCFQQYMRRDDKDVNLLISYADRLKNGAIFKRLGFIAEKFSDDAELVNSCRRRLTKGDAVLDPSIKSPRKITRWRLRVPESWVHDR